MPLDCLDIALSDAFLRDLDSKGAATGMKTLVMRIPGRNVSILHGEQLALIISLILCQAPATSRPLTVQSSSATHRPPQLSSTDRRQPN